MAFPRIPMESIPWPNTLGRPAALAATSSVCIGLKSPEAPAYLTRSVRVRMWLLTGASSPTWTSPSCSMAGPYLTRVSGRTELVLDLALLRAGDRVVEGEVERAGVGEAAALHDGPGPCVHGHGLPPDPRRPERLEGSVDQRPRAL